MPFPCAEHNIQSSVLVKVSAFAYSSSVETFLLGVSLIYSGPGSLCPLDPTASSFWLSRLPNNVVALLVFRGVQRAHPLFTRVHRFKLRTVGTAKWSTLEATI